MEKSFQMKVILLFLQKIWQFLKDYYLHLNNNNEIPTSNIPECKCKKEQGKVRPNILLYNDSEWNT